GGNPRPLRRGMLPKNILDDSTRPPTRAAEHPFAELDTRANGRGERLHRLGPAFRQEPRGSRLRAVAARARARPADRRAADAQLRAAARPRALLRLRAA